MFSRLQKGKSTDKTTKSSSKDLSRPSTMIGHVVTITGCTQKKKPWLKRTDVWNVLIVHARKLVQQASTSDNSSIRSKIKTTTEQQRQFWVIIHSGYRVEVYAQSVNYVHQHVMPIGSKEEPSKLESCNSLPSKYLNKWKSNKLRTLI